MQLATGLRAITLPYATVSLPLFPRRSSPGRRYNRCDEALPLALFFFAALQQPDCFFSYSPLQLLLLRTSTMSQARDRTSPSDDELSLSVVTRTLPEACAFNMRMIANLAESLSRVNVVRLLY